MENVYSTLTERGYLESATHPDDISRLLGEEKVRFYIGFDATADSLHVGHFIQLMVMMHMQRAGHTPIALIGGGTTMVGDPSGKTDMRKMLTPEEIDANSQKFRKMFARFLDFENGGALLRNNYDWLGGLNYIEFLREIGPYFSVNRMLAAECYKNRLEAGLTFIEFNYMVMQAYDFFVLNERDGCKLQFGGSDQWSNILAGTELIRRKAGKEAFGLTFSLLVNSEGVKMGKTVSGALWLDADKTSPYEFYQYFRNLPDDDIEKCLKLLTFLPLDEVRRLASLPGEGINEAKETLALEVTSLVHSKEDALNAQETSRALFSGIVDESQAPLFTIPTSQASEIGDVCTLLTKVGLADSRSDARRLIEQGGIVINGEKIADPQTKLAPAIFESDIVVRKGKKVFLKVRVC